MSEHVMHCARAKRGFKLICISIVMSRSAVAPHPWPLFVSGHNCRSLQSATACVCVCVCVGGGGGGGEVGWRRGFRGTTPSIAFRKEGCRKPVLAVWGRG